MPRRALLAGVVPRGAAKACAFTAFRGSSSAAPSPESPSTHLSRTPPRGERSLRVRSGAERSSKSRSRCLPLPPGTRTTTPSTREKGEGALSHSACGAVQHRSTSGKAGKARWLLGMRSARRPAVARRRTVRRTCLCIFPHFCFEETFSTRRKRALLAAPCVQSTPS